MKKILSNGNRNHTLLVQRDQELQFVSTSNSNRNHTLLVQRDQELQFVSSRSEFAMGTLNCNFNKHLYYK
jgi:hypothetical protein